MIYKYDIPVGCPPGITSPKMDCRGIIINNTMITIEHVIIIQLDYKTNNIANICNLTSLTITLK